MPSKEILQILIRIGTISSDQAKAFNLLIKQIERTQKAVKGLNQQYERLSKNSKKTVSNSAKITDQIGKERKARVRINKAIQNTISKTKGQSIAVDKSINITKNYNSVIKKTKKSLDQFSNSAKRGAFDGLNKTIKRIIVTMITLQGLFLFKRLVSQGAAFEAMMIRVAATAGATTKQFKQLVEEVRNVAKSTIFTATEVGTVAQILAQAGFETREILDSLNPILELTGATMAELGVTTELLVTILKAFNLETTETARVTNILAEATLSSRANMVRLEEAFRFGGPAGAAFGQSIETTTASLARFIDLGLSASIAGTTFRRSLIELSAAGPRQTKVLDRLGLSLAQVNPSFNDFGDILNTLSKTSLTAQQSLELFGARASSAVFALIQRFREGEETITDFAAKLGDAEGFNKVENLFAKISESIQAQTLLTKSALEELGITLFNTFRPALSKLLLGTRDAFLKLSSELRKKTGLGFSETLEKLVPSVLAALDGLILLATGVGAIITFFAALLGLFKPLAIAFKVLVVWLGLAALRAIILSKALTFLSAALLKKQKALAVATAKMKAHSIATGGAVIKTSLFSKAVIRARIAVIALSGPIGIAIGLFALFFGSFILEKLGLFKDGLDDSADSFDDLSTGVQFGTEQLKKFSKQLGFTIESQKQLNNLIKEGRAIATPDRIIELGSALDFTREVELDLKINPDANLDELLADLKKSMAGFAEENKGLVDNIFRFTDEQKKIFDKDLQELNEKVKKQTDDLKNTITESISRFDLSFIDADKAEKDGEIFADRFLRGIKKGEFEETFRNLQNTPVFETKEVKTVKRTGGSIRSEGGEIEIIKTIVETEIVLNTKQAQKALTDFVGSINSNIDFKELTNKQQVEVAKLFKAVAEGSKDVLTTVIALQNVVVEGAKEGVEAVLVEIEKRANLIKAIEEKINNVISTSGKEGNNALIKSQKTILLLLKDSNTEIKRLAEERKNLKIEQDKAVKGQENAIAVQLAVNALLEKQEKIQKEVTAGLFRRALNIKEAIKQTELNRAKTALQVTETELLNQKIKETTSLLAVEATRFDAILLGSEEVNKSFLSIDEALSSFKDTQKIDKFTASLNEIKRLEVILEKNKKVKDAVVALEKVREDNTKARLELDVATNKGLATEAKRGVLADTEVKETKALLNLSEARTAQSKNQLDLLEKRKQRVIEIQKFELELINVFASIEKRQQKINASDISQPFLEIIKLSERQSSIIEKRISLIDKETDKLRLNVLIAKEAAKEIADTKPKKGGAQKEKEAAAKQAQAAEKQAQFAVKKAQAELNKGLERRNKIVSQGSKFMVKNLEVTEQELKLQLQLQMVMQERNRASILGGAGLKETEKLLNREIDARQKTIKINKEIENTEKEIARLKNIDNRTDNQDLALKNQEKLLEAFKKNAALAEKLKDIGLGEFFGLAGTELKSMVKLFIDSQNPLVAFTNTIKEMGGILKSFGKTQIKTGVDIAFGLIPSEQEKNAKKIRDINEKLADDLLKIRMKLRDDLLKNERKFLDDLLKLEIQNRQEIADINSSFDNERRTFERDIFNERIERLQELARLEQELKFKGLTDDQQRADLISTIDQNLSNIRLGNIEERQIKLSELQAQIEALNTLENTLGVSRAEIDQSSLARLSQLKTETAAFFNDKKIQGTLEIETARKKELDELKKRKASEKNELLRLKLFSDAQLKIEANRAANELKINADKAKMRVEEERKQNSLFKKLGADLTTALIAGIIKVGIAKQSQSLKDTALALKDFVVNSAVALSGLAAKAPILFPILGALMTAALLVIKNNAFEKGGEVKEIKRATGGVITGGKGGVDDIHTAMKAGSYVVNKASTRTHREELNQMVSGVKNTRNAIANVPVAVTAGEFEIPPQIYSQNKNRIEQINRDKNGDTVKTTPFYYGGPVLRRQHGGSIPSSGTGASVVNKNVTINTQVSFPGVNILSGDSEEAISMIYEKGLRDKIQEDMDNRALV